MSEFRSSRKSLSHFAWLAPVIVLLALGLVYFYGHGDTESSIALQTLERSEQHERLRILNPARHHELLPSQPLSPSIRNQVLQRLAELRAKYRMLGPTTTVIARPDAAETMPLAQNIGRLLAIHELGRYVEAPQPANLATTDGRDSMYLHVASQDVAFARNLLTALSPMLACTVTICFDDSLTTGKMWLVVSAKPRFSGQGVAVFPSTED